MELTKLNSIKDQVLAAIPIGDAMAIVTVAGLALIALAFLSFILSQARNAASGRIGEEAEDEEKDD